MIKAKYRVGQTVSTIFDGAMYSGQITKKVYVHWFDKKGFYYKMSNVECLIAEKNILRYSGCTL